MNRTQEREAWTALVEGRKPKRNKFGNERTGKNASKFEAEVAANLWILEKAGVIRDLREQVPLTLIEGKGKIRPVIYVADFHYYDSRGVEHWLDAKGVRTAMFILKKKMALLLKGIEIEEVRKGK